MVMIFTHFNFKKNLYCGASALLGLLLLITLAGCVPEGDDIIIPNIQPSVQELKTNASGGTFTIEVQSNVKWEIIGEFTDWYLASKIDDHTISVDIEKNTTAKDRKTSILLKADNFEVSIPVYQRERAEIIIDDREILLSSKATETSVKVESNYVEWSVHSSEAWLTVTKDQDSFIKLKAEENGSTDNAREAIVTLSADDKEEQIVVKQDYTTVITLSKNTISFPWQGGEEWIEINSNKEVKISPKTILPRIFELSEEEISTNTKRLYIKMRRYRYEKELAFNLNVSTSDIVIPIHITVEASMFNKNQMEALRALYTATDGDNWTRNDNWLSDKPITEWYGVVGNDLTGIPEKEPTISIFSLELSDNNLVGEIPKEIGWLDDLVFLHLSNNHLHGVVPKELSSISNLLEIDLSGNEFSGTLPSFLFNDLLSTRVLKLNNNNFEGFTDLDKLIPLKTKLSRIDLRMNKLRGPRPKQLKSRRITTYIDPQQENYGFE